MQNATWLSQFARLIGKRCTYSVNTMTVFCDIRDARVSYGRPQLLIAPVAGAGDAWVNRDSILILEPGDYNA